MKWLLIIIGVLALLVLIVFLVGKLLPVKHTAFQEKQFTTDISSLWSALRNFEDYPKWRSTLKTLTVINEKQWQETDSRGDIITFGIIEEISEAKMAVKILSDDLPFGGTWVYELTEGNGAVTLKITENGEVYSPIYRFIGYFFLDQSATIKQYMIDLELRLNP
ncbi:MAG: polyketide cyclase [Bacteroidota bacterium]